MAYDPNLPIDSELVKNLPAAIREKGASLKELIDTLESSFNAHLADTLKQGVHGIATTTNITLYVDSVNGSNNNPGTESQPLKTIQAAIDRLPQIINHSVTIQLAPGTYNEPIAISGFLTAKANLRIKGGNTIEEAENYIITNSSEDIIKIVRSLDITIQGVKLVCAPVNNKHAINAYSGVNVYVNNCIIDGINPIYQRYGIHIYQGISYVDNVKISNIDTAVSSLANSLITVRNLSGTNNNYALRAESAIIFKRGGINISATTLENKLNGGQIW